MSNRKRASLDLTIYQLKCLWWLLNHDMEALDDAGMRRFCARLRDRVGAELLRDDPGWGQPRRP